MDKNDFAKNMLMLNILSQSACESCEKELSKKNFLSTETKILFLIDSYERISPSFLTQKLKIAKSNIALMCKKMIIDGYIVSSQDLKDKRIVYYKLSDSGKNYLNEKISEIQNSLEAACMKDNIDNITSCIKELNEMLSKRF